MARKKNEVTDVGIGEENTSLAKTQSRKEECQEGSASQVWCPMLVLRADSDLDFARLIYLMHGSHLAKAVELRPLVREWELWRKENLCR